MPRINKPIIDYTSRDFATIKNQLINYAEKYYPEAFQDFNEASFGSLMLDMVSYIGDVLSFYTDYQVNESFLETATEFDNVLNLSKQFGYKYQPNASSFGEASFFVEVPTSAVSAEPDFSYMPILRKGSTFSSDTNTMFTLIEDVDFNASSDQIVVAQTNNFGTAPTHYAIKAKGVVASGETSSQVFTIGAYQKFLRLEISDTNLTEIISVFDSDGNNYYEVDYLTQDTVFVPVLNTLAETKSVRNILKPITVPRRFVVEKNISNTFLQFGYGTGDNVEKVLDPTSVILDRFGKDYIQEKSFDPTDLIKTDKLGVVPSETLLTVIYRRNTTATVNIATGRLKNVITARWRYPGSQDQSLNVVKTSRIENSLEVLNEEAITGDAALMSSDELKQRALGAYGAQNRAVTKEDYIYLAYNMPSMFGQVKKAMITRDTDSFNGKNLNMYTISVDPDGKLVQTNSVIKKNLKTWLSKYKLLGDTIDILDAKIMNLEISFTLIAYMNINKYDVLDACMTTLTNFYRNKYFDIGEPFKITDVYKLLNNVSSVLDVKDVTVVPKSGGNYSDFELLYGDMILDDGRYLIPPEDVIFELKYSSLDVQGEVL